jgi:hypothetical protein
MIEIKKMSLWMLALIMMPLMVACSGSDDDVEVSLDTYIIGLWHSYEGNVYYNGESKTASIDKTGQFSQSYIEIQFSNNKKATIWGWVQDEYGLSHWTEETDTYTIKGNTVTLYDENEASVDLLFDRSNKTLMIRGVQMVDGKQATVNIYLKK